MATRNRDQRKPQHRARDTFPEIEDWELVDELGRGRWLVAYRARPRHLAFDCPADYVVKVPVDEADPELVTRMMSQEATVSRQVAHPNVQTVLAAHLEVSPNYLVLPYFPGGTWEQVGAAPQWRLLPRCLWIFRQLAEGLQALHQAGWIHGDVTPGNVYVAASGHTTLIDLGMSSRRASSGSDLQGAFRGTLHYAAPESLVAARPNDPRSDIYGLGVLLFQTLSGRLPFLFSDPAQVARAHRCTSPPSLRHLIPQLPVRLARLVERMLAKEPFRRPVAGELVGCLFDLEVATFSETLCPAASVEPGCLNPRDVAWAARRGTPKQCHGFSQHR